MSRAAVGACAAPRLRVAEQAPVCSSEPPPCLRTDGEQPCPAGSAPATPRAGSGYSLLGLALPAALAAVYTRAQLAAATPASGAPATGDFYYGEGVSLLVPCAATAAYLLFCSIGPRVMASRPAMSCKSAMLVYNAYQALFNAVCVALLVAEVRGAGLRAWGNVLGDSWRGEARYGRIAGIVWLHYNNKVRGSCTHSSSSAEGVRMNGACAAQRSQRHARSRQAARRGGATPCGPRRRYPRAARRARARCKPARRAPPAARMCRALPDACTLLRRRRGRRLPRAVC
jgi:hypothetical protein